MQTLRLDICVDREPVYYVLQAIQECRAWRVRDDAIGERLFVDSRSAIEAGWVTFLADLHRLDLTLYPSLLLLLEDFAAKRLEVLAHLREEVCRTDGATKRLVTEAYAGALEHAQQHTVDPEACFCGEVFWLTAESVARAAPETEGVAVQPRWQPGL
ncbi:hypothetical protein GCM10029963_26710 [Micromonospora andamanensis]